MKFRMSGFWMLSTVLLLFEIQNGCCGNDEEVAAKIDEFISDIMTSEQLVGLGAAVVKDGRPILSRGYGTKDLYTGDEVTNETRFYLASCTKAFNAALVSQILAENPGYTFDSRVREIWPEFSLETGYRSEHATIRDLIAHRTGLVESTLPLLAGVYQSRKDYFSRSQFSPAIYPFRHQDSYNNLMVSISGELAATLAQEASWEDALRKNILMPLNMNQTLFVQDMTPEELEAMATPHEMNDGEPKSVDKIIFGDHLGPATPSGGIVINAVDMQKWLMFLTNKGLAEDGSRVMNESDLMRTMREQSVPYFVNIPDEPQQPLVYAFSGIALGWYNGMYRGYNLVTHGGYFFGFHSMVTVLPDKGMAIYTNINCPDGFTNGSAQSRIHAFALDTLLEIVMEERLDVFDFSHGSNLQDNVPFDVDPNTNYDKKQLDLKDFAGTYGNFFMGNMTLSYNSTSDELWGEWGSLGVLQLIPGLQNNSFIGIVQDPLWFFPPLRIQFRSSDGIIIDEMTIPFLMPEAPPVFIRDLQMDDAPPPPTDSCEDVVNVNIG